MKKLLLAASVFVIASCTASISIKAQEFNVDPGLEPAPEAAPLSPNKNKTPPPTIIPDTNQTSVMGCSMLDEFHAVRSKYGEKPLFSAIGLQLIVPPNQYGRGPAQAIKRPMTLYVNPGTGTWTLVSF